MFMPKQSFFAKRLTLTTHHSKCKPGRFQEKMTQNNNQACEQGKALAVCFSPKQQPDTEQFLILKLGTEFTTFHFVPDL